ncbi:HET-domain-containing protein [Pleurostoma richardsiae]|uniref:HET-domain-containing protein n=1 Tax=Pleurostoma richardsiae TaxID=41990 RepID=A0AA38RJ68_9PEZI|nr:HET-domain-containing protein [Pleurostoma richardsiae]
MRLLNSSTLKLREFAGSDIPPYAILSHTWDHDGGEVTFRDMQDPEQCSSAAGFSKIASCCARAQQDGLSWVWIDAVCIDRSSAADLCEAANAMYRWYASAEVCYAYLADVSPPAAGAGLLAGTRGGGRFRRARWFTRGWTLQELLAPREIEFYAQDWTELGTRRSLAALISRATGVPAALLHQGQSAGGGSGLAACSVAERMSWAARRSTTRPEDMAYCLMGLFGVNMPVLYGEGAERAFVRLQGEIMRREEDYTLFLWRSPSGEPVKGFFAHSPQSFLPTGPHSLGSKRSCRYAEIKASRAFTRGKSTVPEECSRPCEVTPRGVRISLWTRPFGRKKLAWTFAFYYDQMVCVLLDRLEGAHSRCVSYTRSAAECVVLQATLDGFGLEEIYIPERRSEPTPISHPLKLDQGVMLRLDASPIGSLSIKNTYPDCKPQPLEDGMYMIRLQRNGAGGMLAVVMSATHGARETLFFASFVFSPGVKSCQILPYDSNTSLDAKFTNGDLSSASAADASDRVMVRLVDGSSVSAAVKVRLGGLSARVSLIPGLPN